jgi:hypothetical protein
MLAVPSSSTWPMPQTPVSKGRPGSASVRTPIAPPRADPPSPKQGRADPPRVDGRRMRRRGCRSDPAGTGRRHDPCPRTTPAVRMALRSAGACGDAVSLSDGQDYRGRWPCWGAHPASSARTSPGQPDRTQDQTQPVLGNGSGSHPAVSKRYRYPAVFSCASDVSAHAARRRLAARLSFARRGFFSHVRG